MDLTSALAIITGALAAFWHSFSHQKLYAQAQETNTVSYHIVAVRHPVKPQARPVMKTAFANSMMPPHSISFIAPALADIAFRRRA
jgi:hypothetical protein